MTTESKAREFWLDMQDDPYSEDEIWTYKPRHRNHLIHVIEKSYADKLQSELKAKDELLEEFIDVASDVVGMEMRTYGRLSNTSGLGSSISILNSFIEKLREGNK